MSKRKYLQYERDELQQRREQQSNAHNTNGLERLDTTDFNQKRELASSTLEVESSEHPQEGQTTKRDRTSERSRKAAKLLDALDVLLLDPEDFDKDTLSQCETLRRSLKKHRYHSLSPSTLITVLTSTSKTNRAVLTDGGHSNVPPPSSLTPWTSSLIPSNIPTLPAIGIPALETATFTHSGMTSNADVLSYERLEWVGDAYLYLISTLLISSTFTSHLPGKCAQIRELLIKNETLASYARKYGFEKRAHLPSEFSNSSQSRHKATDGEKKKVMGDIFEAYVAALILSDPKHGVDRVSSWLKDLWAQTISKQIIDQERLNEISKAKAAGGVDTNPNSKDMLYRKIGAKGVKITYRDIESESEEKDPTTNSLVFTVGVYLDGWGEQNKLLGTGKASGKKDAGMKAAEMALANKKLMALYEEMKRVHDVKLKTEKESGIGGGRKQSNCFGGEVAKG